MSQPLLHPGDVGAVIEGVGGRSRPERMGTEAAWIDADLFRIIHDHAFLDRCGSQWLAEGAVVGVFHRAWRQLNQSAIGRQRTFVSLARAYRQAISTFRSLSQILSSGDSSSSRIEQQRIGLEFCGCTGSGRIISGTMKGGLRRLRLLVILVTIKRVIVTKTGFMTSTQTKPSDRF